MPGTCLGSSGGAAGSVTLARQPGRGWQHAGHLGCWEVSACRQQALLCRWHRRHLWGPLAQGQVLLWKELAPERPGKVPSSRAWLWPGAAAEAAAGAGPGTPAEAAPWKVGRALEFHRAHLQGSALAPGLGNGGLPAVGRQTGASLISGGSSLSPAMHGAQLPW